MIFIRTWTILLLVPLLLLSGCPPAAAAGVPTKYEPEDGYHHYIRWSDLARRAAGDRYPGASLTDFLYAGCKAESPGSKQFVYKFWMREDGKEFGVYVTVEAANGTGKPRIARIEKTEVLNPAYRQWGRYASEAVKAKYPGVEIVGYKPFGCQWLGNDAARQVFRFWIRQAGQNRLLRVTVDYGVRTRRPLAVKIETLRDFQAAAGRFRD